MTGEAADGPHATGESDALSAVAEAEDAVRPALAEVLRSAVEADDAVASRLRDWADGVGSAGYDAGAAIDRAAARQASVLTNHVRYRVAVGSPVPAGLQTTPVTPFVDLDPPGSVVDALDAFESRLAGSPDVTLDCIGARYADSLPDHERRARGQFYTPPAVADAVTRWALDGTVPDGTAPEGSGGTDTGDPPRVLDPAAGTGTFPLAAYDSLRERFPDADPGTLLSRFVAVDVDEVALHLAGLRLSARAGGRPVEALDNRACSFFDLEPGDVAPSGTEGAVAAVDAVVGNPPFVRAGDLTPDRDHFREHLGAFGGEAASPYADGDAALSRRSDAYVYFLTHATRFLRPGGRLGVVLPAKWLESEYGASFRRFLADQYRVRAVVGFGARAFDALVDTVLLLAERRERPGPWDGPAAGDAGGTGGAVDVRFVRLAAPLDASTSLADLVTADADAVDATAAATEAGDVGDADATDAVAAEPSSVGEDGSARVVRRRQSTLASAEKCSPYLRAPAALLPLLDDPGFVRLGDLADVSRGVTTGANRFFLVDGEDRDRWGIDSDLLSPAVRSIRSVESRRLCSADVGLSVVDVHPFLAERPAAADGEDSAAGAKAALREAGHDGLVDYVEHAEERGLHEGRTCRARRVWFDLGELPAPDAFVPKLLRERVFTVRNEAGAVPTNAIDCLSVRDGVDPAVLLGVLDSSLCKALMEVWGRNEAGMLQLMTYETRTLPVPDVRAFSAEEAAAVREAAADFDADGDGQAALDAAVHAALDVDLSAADARGMRERLLGRRVDGGDRQEVPVSTD